MKKITRSFIALAMFTSLAGFTGCKKDVTPNVPDVPVNPGDNYKIDPDNKLPILPFGILDETNFYSSTYLKVNKDAVGEQVFFRSDLLKNASYFSDFQYLKWNKQTEDWEALTLNTGDYPERITLTVESGVNYYCFTYANSGKQYVSPVITIECGTDKTNTIGNFVYSDGTYSDVYNSGKTLIGLVADVNDFGYPTLILYNEINNDAINGNNTKDKALDRRDSINAFFNKTVDYKWDLPTVNQFQQVFANSVVLNKKIKDNNVQMNTLFRSNSLECQYYLKEDAIVGTYKFLAKGTTGCFDYFYVSKFSIGKKTEDPELINNIWDNGCFFNAINRLKYDFNKKKCIVQEVGSIWKKINPTAEEFNDWATITNIEIRDNNYIKLSMISDIVEGNEPTTADYEYKIENGVMTWIDTATNKITKNYKDIGRAPSKYCGTWVLNGSTEDVSLTIDSNGQFASIKYPDNKEDYYIFEVKDNQLLFKKYATKNNDEYTSIASMNDYIEYVEFVGTASKDTLKFYSYITLALNNSFVRTK